MMQKQIVTISNGVTLCSIQTLEYVFVCELRILWADVLDMYYNNCLRFDLFYIWSIVCIFMETSSQIEINTECIILTLFAGILLFFCFYFVLQLILFKSISQLNALKVSHILFLLFMN